MVHKHPGLVPVCDEEDAVNVVSEFCFLRRQMVLCSRTSRTCAALYIPQM
jgi:hypothetical protein